MVTVFLFSAFCVCVCMCSWIDGLLDEDSDLYKLVRGCLCVYVYVRSKTLSRSVKK